MRHGRLRKPREAQPQIPFELDVERLVWGGKALGRHDGKVVFVPKAVPGDRVLLRVTSDRKSFAEARIQSIVRPASGRVDPGCPWFERCGGCQWLAADYALQAAEKQDMLRGALRHHLEGLRLEPLLPATPELAYRHRGDFHVESHGDITRLGFFEEGSHRLAEVTGCLLFGAEFNDALERVRAALSGHPGGRCLDRLTLAHSEEGPVRLAAHGRMKTGTEEGKALALVEPLMAGGLEGVVLTEGAGGRVLAASGTPWIGFGVPSVRGEIRLRADVRSFTQAHFAMNRELVRTALEWLAPSPGGRFLDLYAGVGNFSLALARSCGEVVAVEGSPTACADALFNAEANGITNVRHLEGDVARRLAGLAVAGERFDGVLLDPPRAGAKDALEGLARLDPARILYVSCNLPALERDLALLKKLGYHVTRARGFDCFPQTYGLEALCLLERG